MEGGQTINNPFKVAHMITLRMKAKLASMVENLVKHQTDIETKFNTGVIDGFNEKPFSQLI